MSSNNAIGHGALILSTNADAMLKGMDAAAGKAREKGAKIGKAAGTGASSGGGILGSLLGGISGGAAFALVTKGIEGVASAIAGIPDQVDRLKEKFSGTDLAAPLNRASKAFTDIQTAADKLLAKGLGALAPAADRVAEAFDSWLGKAQPTIDRLSEGFGKLVDKGIAKALPFVEKLADMLLVGLEKAQPLLNFLVSSFERGAKLVEGLADGVATLADRFASGLGVSLADVQDGLDGIAYFADAVLSEFLSGLGDVVQSVGDVVASVGQWVAATLGLTDTSTTMGEKLIGVAKAVAQAFAYCWDTLKAGAGVMSVVGGIITTGFAAIVKVVGDAVLKLAELADNLPEALRPGWISKAGETVRGWGESADAAGRGMMKWGADAIMNWGNAAEQAGAWFDGLADRFKNRQRDVLEEVKRGVDLMKTPQLSGAMLKGSQEAYSVVAKFNAGNDVKTSNDKLQEQIRLQRDQIKVLDKILDALAGRPEIAIF